MTLKRKRSPKDEDDAESHSDSGISFREMAGSDEEIDVFTSLTGAKKQPVSLEEDGDDDEELIRETMAKKLAKDGTALLKKMKGKTKMVKGEIGGGSFQSMGKIILESHFHYLNFYSTSAMVASIANFARI